MDFSIPELDRIIGSEKPTSFEDSFDRESKTLNKNCLSYWYPALVRAGLPTPKTHIEFASKEVVKAIYNAFDGKGDISLLEDFANRLRVGYEKITNDKREYPVFLRSGETSYKHDWKETCFVSCNDAEAKKAGLPTLVERIINIATFQEMMNLPYPITWVMREYLPVIPLGICPKYGNFPVTKEFRVFVDGPKIICWHPYWPLDALKDGGFQPKEHVFNYDDFCNSHDIDGVLELASRAGEALGGKWSVDILLTAKEPIWYVTDCAVAAASWHWPGCKRTEYCES